MPAKFKLAHQMLRGDALRHFKEAEETHNPLLTQQGQHLQPNPARDTDGSFTATLRGFRELWFDERKKGNDSPLETQKRYMRNHIRVPSDKLRIRSAYKMLTEINDRLELFPENAPAATGVKLRESELKAILIRMVPDAWVSDLEDNLNQSLSAKTVAELLEMFTWKEMAAEKKGEVPKPNPRKQPPQKRGDKSKQSGGLKTKFCRTCRDKGERKKSIRSTTLKSVWGEKATPRKRTGRSGTGEKEKTRPRQASEWRSWTRNKYKKSSNSTCYLKRCKDERSRNGRDDTRPISLVLN